MLLGLKGVCVCLVIKACTEIAEVMSSIKFKQQKSRSDKGFVNLLREAVAGK